MEKPQKPSPEFPLYAHASGKWAKKIKGKLHYFGRWDDPDGALHEYQEAIRPADSPSEVAMGPLTLKDAGNLFLAAKQSAMDAGELSERSWKDYKSTCQWLADFFGKNTPVTALTPGDWGNYKTHLRNRRNVVSTGNEVRRIRVFGKWLWEAKWIREPIDYGPDFKAPSAKSLRRHKRESGKKLYAAKQVRALLLESGTHMRAMIYLGINCGFGPTDICRLKLGHVDLDAAWIDYPRPKTEIDREVPLWPETVAAMRESMANRPKPVKADKDLFFVYRDGRSWDLSYNPLLRRFNAIKAWAGVKDGGLYWLRHTLETVGGGAKDQVALDHIMGHADASMAAVYREEIERDRLRAVTDHVREWLLKKE